jgi:hypothetical protein
VFRLEPIHVDAEGEELCGFKEIEFTFEEQGVRAEINILFAGDEAFHDFVDLRMDERFPAGDGDHGGAAFVRGRPALLGGEALIENVIGVLDFSATSAGQIATEEGLEHEHEGVPLVAAQFLSQNVGGDGPSLADGNWHKGSRKATNPDGYVNGTR